MTNAKHFKIRTSALAFDKLLGTCQTQNTLALGQKPQRYDKTQKVTYK